MSAIARAVSKPEHHKVLAQAVAESPVLRSFVSRHVIAMLEGKSELHVSIVHAIKAAGELGEKKHAQALITAFKRLTRPHLAERAAIMTTLFKMGHHETYHGRRFFRGIARDKHIQESLSTFAKKLLQTEKVTPTLRKAVQTVLSESHNPLEIDLLDEVANNSQTFRNWLGKKVMARLRQREGWNLAHAFAAAATLHRMEKKDGNPNNRYALALVHHFNSQLAKTDPSNRMSLLHALEISGYYHTLPGSSFLHKITRSTKEDHRVIETARRMKERTKKAKH